MPFANCSTKTDLSTPLPRSKPKVVSVECQYSDGEKTPSVDEKVAVSIVIGGGPHLRANNNRPVHTIPIFSDKGCATRLHW